MKLRRGTGPQGRRYTRYTLGGVAAGALIAAIAVLLGGGSGNHARTVSPRSVATLPLAAPAPAAGSPQRVTVSPGKGAVPGSSAPGATPGVAVPAGGAAIAQVPDPEAAKSSPAPASVHHAAATTPSAAAARAQVAPGAPSDAEIRRELAQMDAALKAQRQAQQVPAGGGSIGGTGVLTPPPGVPAVVARVIAGGNAIADFPYVFGGGHASFVDSAYDCSGSVSYALAAGGMLAAPLTSGQLMSWGVPGPGKWITVEASNGHVYMYVAGMRFDTSFRSGIFGSRWQPARRTNVGFVARHWPGL